MKFHVIALVFWVLIYASSAWAGDTQTPSETAKTDNGGQSTTNGSDASEGKQGPAPTPSQSDDSKKNDSKKKATFVDKDGDGINDGRENRFRRKSKRQHHSERRKMMRKKKQSGKTRSGNGNRNN